MEEDEMRANPLNSFLLPQRGPAAGREREFNGLGPR